MRIISLGWGVQSFTLAAMAALEELDSVSAAIHADTTYEASATYEFAQRWSLWLENHNVRVITVKPLAAPNPINIRGGVEIPAHTATPTGGGMIRRQCTHEWKRRPIRHWLQSNRNGAQVEQWLGISLDEVQRMRDSNVRYIKHRYPLIERRMTRHDCIQWLQSNSLEVPPKSACTFCPFHDMAAWREMKIKNGADWQEAVRVDEAIRTARPPYDLFLHPAKIPLVDVDLSNQQDRGQLSLWDNECSGVCGV